MNNLKIFFENFNRTPYKKEILFNKKPISKFPGYSNMLLKFQEGNVSYLDNELNSFNYRCDEFKKIHNGLHIVFSGDSYTFGSGLELEECWAKQTYNLISKEKKCSGYFNLGVPGNSIASEISDLFKYFIEYGNPDVIFLNMPYNSRFYGIEKNNICDSVYENSQQFIEIIQLLNYQYYLMLDQYCMSNDIKLFSFSWLNVGYEADEFFSKNNINNFKSFYETNLIEINNFVNEYKTKNPLNKFAEMSRDNIHQGTAYNTYWANFIYDKYLESL
jgi:hypothetical protein